MRATVNVQGDPADVARMPLARSDSVFEHLMQQRRAWYQSWFTDIVTRCRRRTRTTRRIYVADVDLPMLRAEASRSGSEGRLRLARP